jgi:hypothetical protein
VSCEAPPRHDLAHEKPGQTLQATALVHEAYLRLVDGQQAEHMAWLYQQLRRD